MPAHLAADSRLLEDVHGLIHERPRDAELERERVQPRTVGEPFEDRVEIVQRVPDLVDRELLRSAKCARPVECLLLEEAANLIARC